MLGHSDNVFRTFLEALTGYFCWCHLHVAKHLFYDMLMLLAKMHS